MRKFIVGIVATLAILTTNASASIYSCSSLDNKIDSYFNSFTVSGLEVISNANALSALAGNSITSFINIDFSENDHGVNRHANIGDLYRNLQYYFSSLAKNADTDLKANVYFFYSRPNYSNLVGFLRTMKSENLSMNEFVDFIYFYYRVGEIINNIDSPSYMGLGITKKPFDPWLITFLRFNNKSSDKFLGHSNRQYIDFLKSIAFGDFDTASNIANKAGFYTKKIKHIICK